MRHHHKRHRRATILSDLTASTDGVAWSPRVERTDLGKFKGKPRHKTAGGRWCPNLCYQGVDKPLRGASVDNPAMCEAATRSIGKPGRERATVLRGTGRDTSKLYRFCEVYV